MTPLYESLTERKVYINKTMDDAYPLMANAIYENDEIKMILMIWGLSWDRMTLGQANFLTVISYLIQNALLRATRYMDALEKTRYIEGSSILEPEAFTSLVQAYTRAKAKNLAECTLIRIQTVGDLKESGAAVARRLRNSDYLGIYADGGLYILLTNTTADEAEIVQKRLLENGFKNEIVENVAA